MGIFIVLSTFWVLYDYMHSLFFADYWDTLKLYDAYLEGQLNLSLFWQLGSFPEQNWFSEHRILFPRILFLADYVWAGATSHLLIMATVMIQLLQATLLSKSLWKIDALTTRDRFFLSCLAFVACFWLVQSGNLIWGFQICWFLNGLAASLACYWISGSKEGGWKNILGAILACTVATYSLANGLFLCAIVFLNLFKNGSSKSRLFLWAGFSAALGFSYLYHFSVPTHGPYLGFHLLRPVTALYLLTYLGNPASRFLLPAGIFIGAVGLVLYLFLAFRFFRVKLPSFFMQFAFTELTYIVVTAAVTAVGRSSEGLEHATSSRYYGPVLIFWFLIVVLIYSTAAKKKTNLFAIRMGIAIALVLYILPIQIGSVPQRRIRYVKNDEAALAFLSGVHDTAVVHYSLVGPGEAYPWKWLSFMKERRLSIYGEPWSITMGHDLHSDFRVDSIPILYAEVQELRPAIPFNDGYYVSGRIRFSNNEERPKVILFSNNGSIVGFAKTTHRSCLGCFSGYVKGSENRRFEMFGLNRNGSSLSKIQIDQTE